MGETRRRLRGATLGLVALCAALVAGPAWATAADCGGGEVELLQGTDLVTVVGVRVHGIGAECDGQPVGVQFLGNPDGDPQAAASELARSHSDEDPCTGEDEPSGVLRAGTVEVRLCEGSATAPHVDGEHLTRLRLLTTAGSTTVAAPDPGGDLPLTGAQTVQALLVGGAMVLLGAGLLRVPRRLARR